MRSGPVAQQDKPSSPGHGALSISQQRLWVLEHLHRRNPAHDVSRGLRLTGPLDTREFGRAWREVVQQYEILRTEFHAVEGVPHPVVVTSFSPELSAGDWEGVTPEERAARLSQLLGKKPPRTDWRQAYWPAGLIPSRFRAPVVLFKRPKPPFYYIFITSNDPQMGWGARTESGVEIQEADFHYLEILREPKIRKFGEKLAECMASPPAHPQTGDLDRRAASFTHNRLGPT